MFYMKHRGKKLWIEADNTYTMCPRCGKEMQVDLGDAVIEGSLDLYGTAFCCHACSIADAHRHPNERLLAEG